MFGIPFVWVITPGDINRHNDMLCFNVLGDSNEKGAHNTKCNHITNELETRIYFQTPNLTIKNNLQRTKKKKTNSCQ